RAHFVFAEGVERHQGVFAHVHAHGRGTFSLQFLAQGFDGLQQSGFARGIYAKEEADSGGKDFGDEDGADGDEHGDGSSGRDQDGNSVGDEDTQGATEGGHEGGLDEELEKDVAAAGAESFTDADFASAFGDGGEHDIHDDDAADDKEDGNDANHSGGNDAGEIFPEVHERGGIEDTEGVGLVGREMAASAQEDASLVLSFFHPFRTTSLDVDGHVQMSAINLEEGFDGNVGEVVLRLAEDGAEGLGDADDGEGAAINPNFAADGINVREKLGGKIVADHGDGGAAFVVALGDVAALDGLLDINLADVGGDAADAGVIDALRADADFAGGANFGADTHGKLEIIVKGLKVLPSDDFVAASGFDVLLDVGNEGEACDEENIGAEIGDASGDVAVHTGDE